MNRSLLNQRYIPLRKIAAGGMGEIFLARQTGVAGFQRQVVLKRVHRRLSDNPRAVEMFLGEARLAASLSHPNIVQIYDVGEEEGAYFIVMERIMGASLRELAERATRQGLMIPMELSITIIAQVLEGLRYAHGFRDESGQPLKIVHRDVGPTNILVSFDGAVKIVDFGIARAEDQVRHENGVAPGKFAYMAPEAILGRPVDARSDLFSVGVLLYELTVGQRLFRAASFEGMRRVVNDPIPPPTFARAGYPVDLEILVMRALERDPGDRFESAEGMLEELEQFAFDTGLRISRLRLGRFVTSTLGGAHPQLVAPDPVAGEVAGEDLDFDKGLFDGGRLDSDPNAARKQRADRRPRSDSSTAVAVRRAREAMVELMPDEEETEEGETVEIRPSNQAQLRAHTVPPEEPRDGSALIVTDDLVEEVADIEQEEEEPEILVEPPSRDREVTRRRAVDPVTGEPRDPSRDLQQALADITRDLEAATGVPVTRDAAEFRPGVVEDELEQVDRAGTRPADDLELSDAPEHGSEPEEDDSSILEPAAPPESTPEADSGAVAGEDGAAEDDDGLDDGTIELDGESAPEIVSVEDLPPEEEEDLDGPTLAEPKREANRPGQGSQAVSTTDGPAPVAAKKAGKKKRRRGKRRKS